MKLENEYEFISHSKLRHVNIFVNDIVYRNFHMHSDFEIFLVLDGTGIVNFRDNRIEINTGDVVLVSPNEMHEIDANSDTLRLLIIQFSRHFCGDYFTYLRNTQFKTGNMRTVFSEENYKRFLCTIIQLSRAYISQQPFYEFMCVSQMSDLLSMLYRHAEYDILNETEYENNKRRSERMNRISSFIDKNYLYPIKLKDLSDIESVSETHLSHFFSENFGVTFQEYINRKRFEQALRLSNYDNLTLTEISERSGFSDPKYLNKVCYNKYGCSFNEYRKSVFRVSTAEHNQKVDSLERRCPADESIKLLDDFINRKIVVLPYYHCH